MNPRVIILCIEFVSDKVNTGYKALFTLKSEKCWNKVLLFVCGQKSTAMRFKNNNNSGIKSQNIRIKYEIEWEKVKILR